jgi:hypothetical protein
LIAKELEVPVVLEKLEVLERRIVPYHSQLGKITAEHSKRKAGYQGEKNVSYYTQQLPESTLIFHNLRLPRNKSFFEMDLLLITSSFSLIVETKTLAGEIYFDPNFGQLIRTKADKKESFPDPLSQVQRQKWLFNEWLIHSVGSNIPIDYLVVVGNSSTLISTDPGKVHLYKKVIHANKLPLMYKDISSKFKSEILDLKTLRKIRNKLLKEHTPLQYDVLSKFRLTEKDIIKGVQCPACSTIGMTRKHGGWICNQCCTVSKVAHIQALKDYFLLFSNSISNQKCREFLKVDSPDVVNRLLRELNVSSEGKNKGKIYLAPEKIASLALK